MQAITSLRKRDNIQDADCCCIRHSDRHTLSVDVDDYHNQRDRTGDHCTDPCQRDEAVAEGNMEGHWVLDVADIQLDAVAVVAAVVVVGRYFVCMASHAD